MRYRLTFVTGLAVGYLLGTRAGRERYEQIRKGARRISENPAVRNMGEAAVLSGRQAATKAVDAMGDKLPPSVSDRVRAMASGEPQARSSAEWGGAETS